MPENKGEAYDELWRSAERGEVSWEEVLLLQQRNLASARAGGSLQRQASELSDLSLPLQQVGRHEEAIAALRQELKLRREIGDIVEVTRTLYDLGLALKGLGRFHSAIRCLRHAEAGFERLGWSKPAFHSLLTIAGLQARVGCTEKALESFQGALPLAVDSEDTFGGWNRAEILRKMAQLHKLTGDLASALSCEQSAAAASQSFAGDFLGSLNAAEGLYRIGHLHLELRQPWKALIAFQSSREAFLRLGKQKSARRAWEAFRGAQVYASGEVKVMRYSHILLLPD